MMLTYKFLLIRSRCLGCHLLTGVCRRTRSSMFDIPVSESQSLKGLVQHSFVSRSLCLGLLEVKACPLTLQQRTLIRRHRPMNKLGGTAHLQPKHRQDHIEPEYEFVYGSGNTRVYKYGLPALITFGAVIVVICFKVIIESHFFDKKYEPVEIHQHLDNEDPLLMSYVMLALGAPFLGFAVYCCRNVLLRMYYNSSSNEFIAVMLKYGLFTHKVHFKPSDVVVLNTQSMIGNVVIKRYKVACQEENFTNPNVFNIFMGYDISKRPDVGKIQDDLREIIAAAKEHMAEEQSKQFIDRYQQKRKKQHAKKR